LKIEDEISRFDSELGLLNSFIDELAVIGFQDIKKEHHFLAEAIIFKTYRIYERLIRSVFLSCCVLDQTISGTEIKSKLRCDDWNTAESILKAGNKFLDWGSVESTRKIGNLVFENGFPIVDFISPLASTLIDLQRFRNYVAHDSDEAASGFRKSRTQYVRVSASLPETVGELALYRRTRREDIVLRILHRKVLGLGVLIRQL
jgi:hypothetical protein